jgi:hypothetical protein
MTRQGVSGLATRSCAFSSAIGRKTGFRFLLIALAHARRSLKKIAVTGSSDELVIGSFVHDMF